MGESRLVRFLVTVVTALVACCSLAAGAGAQTFVVDTSEDLDNPSGCLQGSCSLRIAIEAANETAGPDRIEFESEAFEGGETITLYEPLPPITDPVEIDATPIAGYEGTPLVEVDGERFAGEATGLEIGAGAGGTSVEGLAIGDFEYGISVNQASTPVSICRDFVGTEMSGHEARPNEFGVEIAPTAVGVRIGAGCPGGGNLISGNLVDGILDFGEGTKIADNRIGTDALGGPLPNGTAGPGPVPNGGIVVSEEATGTRIGGGRGEAGAGNTIAHNEGAGVFVDAAASHVAAFANSIHSNTGLGIEIGGTARPPVPSLAAVDLGAAETIATGTVLGAPSETYAVEIFANSACDPSGSGEGETYLGNAQLITDSGGSGEFSVHGQAAPLGQETITATATDQATQTTSEFSGCRVEGEATAPTEPPAPPPIGVGPPPPAAPIPVNGQTVSVGTVAGKVLVRKHGEKKPHRLGDGEAIPVGSIVDATHGKVVLTSADPGGGKQSATFHGGAFRVGQKTGASLVVLKLHGGGFRSCRRAGKGSRVLARRGHGRHLWGSGKGHFKTVGRHGAATVRGTIWLTADRCRGTFFKVKRGVVTVRDFSAHRTLKLRKGHTYLTGG